MKRHILTGAPGAGKTAILRALERAGFAVVEEAATDVIALTHARGIAEPHLCPDFTEEIAALQAERRRRAQAMAAETVIFDRSPICTAALCALLGRPIGPVLAEELARVEAEGVYERDVFFVEMMGFVTPTAARRITYEESLRFEVLHRQAYAERGYRCHSIAAGPVVDRAATIQALLPG